jgi:tetratricopeptide (TPR) repeat protein
LGKCGTGEKGFAYCYRGNAYFYREQYEKAIDDYSKVIELNPLSKCEPYYNRGLAYFRLFEFDKALADFNKAVELKPENEDAREFLIFLYYYSHQYDKVLSECKKSWISSSNYHCARIYYMISGMEDATEKIKKNSKDVDAYSDRAWAYFNRGQYDKAVDDYSKVIEISSEDAGAYFLRGRSYHYLRKYNEAISDYDEAIRIDSKYDFAYYSRGLAYLAINECDIAKSDFEKAIELNKDDKDIYNSHQAYYYNALGGYWWYCKKDKEKALESFEKAFKLGKGDEDVFTTLYDEASVGYFIKDLRTTPEFIALLKKYWPMVLHW